MGGVGDLGAQTAVASHADEGAIDTYGLAYDSLRDLYWAIGWSGGLFTYDPNAGYARTLMASGSRPPRQTGSAHTPVFS